MELKGSRTEQNLMSAFAGESMARNKYTFYAAQAKKDGYEEIAAIFRETAENEQAHAKIWYKLLHNGIADTGANLRDAAEGEHYEWSEMYAGFAAVAREEGFAHIASLFDGVAKIESHHEQRFRAQLAHIQAHTVFQREAEQLWICRNCGHIHQGTAAPLSCPVCSHAQSYFAVLRQA